MDRAELHQRLRYLLSLREAERQVAVAALSPEERRELRHHWRLFARLAQLPPAADWRIWLILAGRGFGKTRAGAEWVRALAEADPGVRIALVGATLCLVRWGPGIRWRGVVLLEVALVVLWLLEQAGPMPRSDAFVLVFFSVALPMTQALSLWSWDVVLELDSARRTEARLAAVQERLRLAGELHDLQGHHLQVIALQLELLELCLDLSFDYYLVIFRSYDIEQILLGSLHDH